MRRNNLDICVEILQVARMGAKKTHIVYKANLNFRIVIEYINRLIKSGMLFSAKNSGIYTTTERGEKFLKSYYEFIIPLKAI